ncbi:Nucleotide-binding alpha-beta plait [Penicillium chermesinum]|uniref:Nucleotide-binding alpha-beta plait n=1 Tax=Penicillium chermesinum TaxID=63820 RepID=A0A9W9TW09_9EURO|nr:Nucleotide-binding alpha-beta plait [Penicillium chermesinum]KAJ5245856.1 Nucleotide-binding alpha-beta plait [Penicillium chermesinum]KAJ6144153.1 Nucleotide-binding alpha-beta plait [Penicillium chermesinum]
MPFLGKEKRRSPRSLKSDDEFVVFLQGIPGHCRWQELKDLVRQTAQHIRQAVVYDDSHGFPTGLGQIIIKNEDEAWRTYHRLSTNGWEGQSLVVTLSRISAPTKPIAGPTRSPPAVLQTFVPGHSTPPRSHGSMALPPSPVSPDCTQSTSSTYQYTEYGPMMGPMPISPQQFMPVMTEPMTQPMQCYPPSPMMHAAMYDAPGWNMMPMYPISPISPIQPLHDSGEYTHWHPQEPWATHTANINAPFPSQTSRAVYINNLNPSTTTADLRSLLQGTGNVEECNVTVTSDAYDKEVQTHGSAIMHSVEDARRAVATLNNVMFMGSCIRVRTDYRHAARSGSWDSAMTQDSDPVSESGSELSSVSEDHGEGIPFQKAADPGQPLVVDGSGQQRRSLEMLSTSAPN